MNNLKILLVDDEEELVSALAERLGYRGIESRCAVNGRQAVDLVKKENFDAVVLDLKLPGMNGLEVRNIIRGERPALPVIMITGHGAPLDRLEAKPEKDCEFLEKPVSLDALIEKIRDVVKK